MHICLNRATAGAGLPFDQFLDLASAAGFHGADVDFSLALEHGKNALRDLFLSKRLAFGGYGIPFDWRGEESLQHDGLQRLRQIAPFAASLNIDSCGGAVLPSSPRPFLENWTFHLSRLTPVARILADNGLRLALEFIGPYHQRRKFPHEFLSTPGQVLELANSIGPNVGLLIDTYHLHTTATPWEFLSHLPRQTIPWVHLNDAHNLPLSTLDDFDRALPGEGILDLPAFIAALELSGFDGPVSLEVFSPVLKTLSPLDAAKRAWAATAKALPQITPSRPPAGL